MSKDRDENLPASFYNKGPILEVLQRFIPADASGCVLEIASGSGEHTAHFAAAFLSLAFQPTEYDAACLPRIAADTASFAPRVRAPFSLDSSQPFATWNAAGVLEHAYSHAVCINMVHISPWECTLGLFAGLARALQPGALLFTYGPYNVDGKFTHVSNEQFDVSLKQRNPAWGVRDIGDLQTVAVASGFTLVERVPMPFDNFTLVWRFGGAAM